MSNSLSLRRTRLLTYGGLFLLAGFAAVFLAYGLNPDRLSPPAAPPQAGGMTTLSLRSSQAFMLPAPGLTVAEADQHLAGDVSFDAVFVTAPAPVNPGLGPLFDNSSCVGCHLRNGRGLPELGQALVRVSLPETTTQPKVRAEGVIPVPNLGSQVQNHAVYGVQPEAEMTLTWTTQTGTYGDGRPYELRSPQLQLIPTDPQTPQNLLTSLRIPPPVFGLGLLEIVPQDTLETLADPDDRDRDGISGRLNWAWALETKTLEVGRFGWKANAPTLLSQTAAAYVNDMGIGNPLALDTEGHQDIDLATLEASTFYVRTLGVPARTQWTDPVVQTGEKLFDQANCVACHVATLTTGPSAIQALAQQTIHPYTDLLLHDMGAGLADGRPDFEATGQEWRTAPLWGIGLTQTVLPYSGYLHDGRARTLEEAILWHGGEAEASKQEFMALAETDRTALLKFLNSL
ncbi:MAG: di-heme oxidoredictase family protein [Prochlorothrix sp.]